jgi:ribonuclease Y
MNSTLLIALIGLSLGLVLQFLLRAYLNWYAKQQSDSQAKDMIETAQEKAEEMMDIAKEKVAEYERELQEKNEKFFLQKEEKNQKLQSQTDRLRNQLQSQWQKKKNQVDKSEKVVLNHANLVETQELKARKLRDHLLKQKQRLAELIIDHFKIDKDEILQKHASRIVDQTRNKINEELENAENKLKDRSEKQAKKVLNNVIQRFIRPYCPERGIGFIMKEPRVCQCLVLTL